MKKTLLGVVYFSMFLGFVSLAYHFISRGLSSWGRACYSELFLFPLDEVSDFTIDQGGDFIIYSGNHYRLQIFDNKGEFVRGWYAYSPGRAVDLKINETGQIEVLATHGIRYLFDKNGTLVSKTDGNRISAKWHRMAKDEVRLDSSGNKYNLERGFFVNRIIKQDRMGNRHTIIKDSLFIWRIQLPSATGDSLIRLFS